MPRAVIYVRVSTADQVENYSLETQEKECSKYCEREGLVVDRIFREEGESAKTVNRTQLQEMLRYLTSNARKHEVTTVVVYRVDRLAREVGGHHTIKAALSKLDVTLASVMERFDETPTGKLTENLMAVLAQFDNDLRSQRSIDGMKAAVAHGKWVWKPPYGYVSGTKSEPSLLVDSDTAPIVKEMFLRVANGEQKDTVRRWASHQGLVTSHGRPLSPSQFQRMLENRLYIGEIVLPKWGVTRQGDFEPLLSKELFALAGLSIAKHGSHTGARALDNPDFPLRRSIRCGACSVPLTASWSTGRNKQRYGYYRCRNRDCYGTKVRTEAMDEAFELWLQGASIPDRLFDALAEVVRDVVQEAQKGRDASRDEVSRALGGLERQEEKLVETYLAGSSLNEETFNRHLAKIERDRIQLRDEMATLLVEDLDMSFAIAKARSIFVDLPASWKHLEPLQRQQFLRILVPHGLVFENGVVRNGETLSGVRGILDLIEGEMHLAAPTGFEPVSPP